MQAVHYPARSLRVPRPLAATASPPRMPASPPSAPDGDDQRGSSRLFRRTLLRVMTVQVLSLLALWLLQATYAR